MKTKKYLAMLCALTMMVVSGIGLQRLVFRTADAAMTREKASGYASLGEAVQAARYQMRTVAQAGRTTALATNPAQHFSASFTPEQVQLQSASACQQPWQLGLKLKGYGYGKTLHEVTAGELITKENRVEIKRDFVSSPISNLQSPILEWYTNTPQGIEQGFTLQERPASEQTLTPLRLVLEVQGEWQAKADAKGQAITLQNSSTSLRYDELHAFDATGRELPARMELTGKELALVVNDAGAVWPLTIDPTLSQQTQFTASNGAASDQFGYSVAISGDTAIVGVPDNDFAPTFNQGSAYVFVRSNNVWSQQAQLIANDAANNDAFGWSVAISGDTAVIGAYNDDIGGNGDQGSAYVFVRNGSTWTQQAKLTSSDGATNDWFGYSVAVSGDLAVIGAPLNDLGFQSNLGAAYIFVRNGSSWSQERILRASDAADNYNFGYAVALSGSTAIVGSPAASVSGNSAQGAAYVFVRSGTSWSQQQQLTASNGLSSDQFGFSVAISNDTAVIGAPQDDIGSNSDQGSAYVFVRSGTTWSQQQQLTAGNGTSSDQFGYSVGISNEMAVVGAPTDDVSANADQGSAYVFTRSGVSWSQQQQLTASNGAAYDNLGWAVAISGYTIVVGAPADDVGANTDQGSAYIFSPTCPNITLNPTTVPSGTQNLAYTTTAITPSSGTSPVTYEITSGALPGGLTLSASGVLSGTPTVSGNFNFTVKITDANLCVGSRAYSLAIASCAPPSVTTQPTNQTGQVAGSVSFTANAGGTPPTVQWQVSTDNGNNWTNLTGATNTTLTLSNLTITMHSNQYRAVFTNACGTATSTAATLSVGQLTPTVTLASSSTTTTYGQSVTLTATVSGAVNTSGVVTFKDGATTLGTGTLNNGQAALLTAALTAGSHSLTAEYSGDTNYFGGTSGALTQTINKATLTVTAENKAKSYGTANPDLTATITGFVNNESSNVISGTSTLTTNASTGSGVGSYTITAALGTLAAANYNFTFVDGALTISKALLTVTADNKARAYGASNPNLTATITGFVNNDNNTVVSGEAALATSATTSSAANAYSITAAPGTLAAANYDFAFVNGTLTVSKASLTVTADNKTKVYGAALPDFSYSLTGFLNNDTASVVTGAPTLTTTATTSSNVGQYAIAAAAGTLAASNYDFVFASGALTIGKATLTVTADNQTRTYGAVNPTLTATFSGFVNGDTAQALSGEAALTTTASASSAVGSYPITAATGTLAATNYDFNFAGGTLTIGQATLTVTADNKSRVYGTANPALTVQYSGFVNNDNASSLTGAPVVTTNAIASSAIGTLPITVAQGTLAAANYQFTFVNGTLTISKATLTVQTNDATRSYGAANPALTGTIAGVQNNDNITASFTTAATNASAVGTYAITATLNDPDNKAGNYDLTLTNGTLTVTKATLTVTADNKARNYGAANPDFTATITGFVNNETQNVLGGTLQISSNANASSAVGNYPITASGFTSANYAITYVTGTLTINQATLTVTADNKSRSYGAANPDFTVTYAGFVNNETQSALGGTLQVSSNANASSAVGTYPITASGLTSANYAITFVNGTLTVNKAMLTVTADNKARTYGATNPDFTATITGFANGENNTALSGSAALSTTATATSNVGTYTITTAAGTLAATNYDFTFSNGTLTVNKAALTVVADNKARTYGAANPTLTATLSGFVNNETASVVTGAATLSTTATQTSNAGTYAITVATGTLAATNYNFTLSDGTLTINKAHLTVTADDKSRQYGSANPAFTATITGFVNGETSVVVNGAAALSTTATTSSPASTYAITAAAGTLAATNYDFTFVNGTLTVGKATLTVMAENKTKVFGAALPDFTYKFTGFLNGDTASAVNGAPSLTTTASSGSNAGSYSITIAAGTLAATSYDFVFTNGTLTISAANTALTLVSDAPSALLGQNVTLTTIINPVAPGAGTPTGTITFKNGSTTLGTAQLTNGQARFTTKQLAIGTYSLTAVFAGSENFSGSTSSPLAQSVSKAAAAVTLASSLDTTTYGQMVTLNVTVSGAGATPSGTVRFMDGSSLLGTATLASGVASLSLKTLSVGLHNITVIYDGDTQNQGGTSRVLSL
ncbi:MAG: MBG domain-containing protein, partial [Blastocatellia bacterium]